MNASTDPAIGTPADPKAAERERRERYTATSRRVAGLQGRHARWGAVFGRFLRKPEREAVRDVQCAIDDERTRLAQEYHAGGDPVPDLSVYIEPQNVFPADLPDPPTADEIRSSPGAWGARNLPYLSQRHIRRRVPEPAGAASQNSLFHETPGPRLDFGDLTELP